MELDTIIGSLTQNKVFQQVNVDARYEQGSVAAKNTITLPGQCMPPSLLEFRRNAPLVKEPAKAPTSEPVKAPTPEPVKAPAVEPVKAPAPEPVKAPTVDKKTWTLKELKKEKVAVIHEIAQEQGISLINEDTKRKKVKEELMNEIVAN